MTTLGIALWGATTGTLGLALSLLLFLRDGPRVQITLHLTEEFAAPGSDGCVNIVNVGRRPIFLTHIFMRPQRRGGNTIIFNTNGGGVTLREGAEPMSVPIRHEVFVDAGAWWKIRVEVLDITGRPYKSLRLTERPSFTSEEAPPLALVLSRALNALSVLRSRLLL